MVKAISFNHRNYYFQTEMNQMFMEDVMLVLTSVRILREVSRISQIIGGISASGAGKCILWGNKEATDVYVVKVGE